MLDLRMGFFEDWPLIELLNSASLALDFVNFKLPNAADASL